MPISSVKRMWSKGDWTHTSDGETFTDGYDVLLTTTTGEHPIGLIRLAIEIPARGTAHPELAGFWVKSRSARPEGGPNHWVIVLVYGNSAKFNDSGDPTLEPPEIEYGGENVEEEIDTDAAGNPIVTTAGEPFTPSILRPFADFTVDYSANVLASLINIDFLRSYANKTNSDDWAGVGDAGEVLIDGPIRSRYRYATLEIPAYYEINIKLKLRDPYTDPGAPAASAWHARVLNRGFRYRNDEGEVVTAVGPNRLPYNQPVLLDVAGAITETPYFLYFQRYESVAFAPLIAAIGIAFP